MKILIRLVFLLCLITVVLWPRPAAAQVLNCEKFVAGGSYTLKAGETLDGDLCVLGGVAQVEPGATVNGDVILVGGSLQMDGAVIASIQAAGGIITLDEGSTVGGDIHLMGGKVVGLEAAQVAGEVDRLEQAIFPFSFQGINLTPASHYENLFLKILWLPLRSFLWAALAVLAALFLPQRLKITGQSASQSLLTSGAIGLTGLLVGAVIAALLAITLICLPFSLVFILVVLAAWVLGLLAISLEIGGRLARLMKLSWAPAVSAAVGAFLLTLVLNGIELAVPCLGWLPGFLVGCVGLGAAFLTRFGAYRYPPQLPAVDGNDLKTESL